jgi:hypothetical protein
MRRIALAAALGAFTVPPAQAQERVNADFGRGDVVFERDRGLTTGMAPGQPDVVYQAFRQASIDLGLPLKDKNENPAGQEFLLDRHRFVSRFGKKPLSAYLSCGDGLTGPNADSWFVFITMRGKVTPAKDGASQIQITLTADAVDVPGGRNDKVVCATRGVLESDMIKRAQIALLK